jgi:hypothetical protein
VSDLTPGRPDLAVATVLAGESAPIRNRVSVDLSQFRTSRIVLDFADFDRRPFVGDLVEACDLIDHREASAEVLGVNEREHTAAIVIDWATVREVSA